MSNDNYPAGVSDSHPYFNPPREVALELECGADEALVIPSFAVKTHLNYLDELIKLAAKGRAVDVLPEMAVMLERLREQIDELEQEREYECPFKGEVDVEESAEAHWDCQVCGGDRTVDTLPEERDPDEGWDTRHDD